MTLNTRANNTISCIGGRQPDRLFPAAEGQSVEIKQIGGIGMKDRKRQRANRKAKHHEEGLDKHSGYGYKDLTPYNAVLKMKTDGKATIALK